MTMFDDDEAHMGHIFLDCMKKRPNAICQIDAATGEEETNASVLNRSVRLAQSLRKLGLVPGDVLVIGGNNHINVHIPFYAAILNGLPVAGVDPLFKLDEVRAFFKLTAPKIAFCDSEHYNIYITAASDLGLSTRVVTYGTGAGSMRDLIKNCDDDSPVEEFQPAKIDQDKIYAWLVSSGGTTGVLKVAAIRHNTWRLKMQTMLLKIVKTRDVNSSSHVNEPALNLSPVQWISGFFNAITMPLIHQTKIQTSAPATVDHIIDIINKYRPVSALLGPSLVSGILKSSKQCDFTCFSSIFLTGGKVYSDMMTALRKRVRADALVIEAYGQTESVGAVFSPNPLGPVGNCGRAYEGVLAKLVDPESGNEITEPNVTGELWTKTSCFAVRNGLVQVMDRAMLGFYSGIESEMKETLRKPKEYYNNPEETARAFTEDGWYKTGDLLYRDKEDNYYFVERLKMLIKYRNYHIVPPEVEAVIRSHDGVQEVSVTSVPHEEDGEHAVACVVRRPGSTVSAQAIKDLVANKLSETKQLRGGVVFMDSLPMTSTGKVARAKLREIVAKAYRE